MKVAFLNPFFKATVEIFQMMLDIQPQRGQFRVQEDEVTTHEANAIIGITGQVSGSVLFSFPKEMALEMVRIMSGMEMKELDSFVASALGEIANIISGNAVIGLSKENYICDVTPPQILIGSHRSLSMASKKSICLPFTTEIGGFEIILSIREK